MAAETSSNTTSIVSLKGFRKEIDEEELPPAVDVTASTHHGSFPQACEHTIDVLQRTNDILRMQARLQSGSGCGVHPLTQLRRHETNLSRLLLSDG